jgi:hypothetical protein
MTIDDWQWLLETAQANANGALTKPIDLTRLRRLAPDCSLSDSEVQKVLNNGGAAGLLVELYSRVCEGRARLQEAIASLPTADDVERARLIAALQQLADSDPYLVNRTVARETLDAIARGRYR